MDKHRAKVATQETITVLITVLVVCCVIAAIYGIGWVIFNFSPILGLLSVFALLVATIWYACYN